MTRLLVHQCTNKGYWKGPKWGWTVPRSSLDVSVVPRFPWVWYGLISNFLCFHNPIMFVGVWDPIQLLIYPPQISQLAYLFSPIYLSHLVLPTYQLLVLILPCFLVGGIPIFGVVKPPILRFLNHLYSPVFGEVPISCPHCITIFGDEILWNPHFLLPGQHLEGDAKQPPTAISCVRLSLAKLCYTKGAKVTIVARTKKKLETLGRWEKPGNDDRVTTGWFE